ncbi:hypothetical protein EGH24_01705 [Halonotius terrestris]|uniref:DUF7312 domain-containing protein n=1 Tax=Halonotius terrestris TaxID=2487750 RepID=A0A8J8TDQ3_9EURY|nr:hypothetical protein [Halonotius terrestris]TQQ83532.1 hypothetical protein EGH24_01705 [Halonotius terrestris]
MSQSADPADADDADDADEWRFAVDDVGPEAEPAAPESDSIEPESISAEHAAFVALGVLLTVAVIATGL